MSFSYNTDLPPRQSGLERLINTMNGRHDLNAPEKKQKKRTTDCSYAILFSCANCIDFQYAHVGNASPAQTLGRMKWSIKNEKNTKNPLVLHCRSHGHEIYSRFNVINEYPEKLTVSKAHSIQKELAEKYNCINKPIRNPSNIPTAVLEIKIPEPKEASSEDGEDEYEEYDERKEMQENVEEVAKQYAELKLNEMKEEYEKKLLEQLKEIERLKSQIPK
jgi:hypothetical protein